MSRWWAPAGAHLGPDEIDLERLKPGTDKKLDLGQYLLTVHRMGAAACEEVASGPIPDEFSLIKRLADARAVFAPPVVEAVSKSLGDRPYADLLVRDVLDDAEQGALQVFRTAVSGGVPAPLAAQRAGMVYGVPPESLGPFLAVAKELRAHPAALTDAADRCLFQAVEKAVLEEMEALEPEYEEVSKAPALLERRAVATPDSLTTPYYDARDITGRFAAGTARPNVAQLLAQAKVGAQEAMPTLRTPKTRRTLRTQRTLKTPVQQKAEAQTALTQAQVASAQVATAQVQRRVMEAFKIKPPATPTGGSKGRGEWPDNLMERVTPDAPYERLADAGELHIAMNSTDFGDMLSRFGEGQMFRIGHVVRRMGQGSVQPPGVALEENISELAGQFFAVTGYEGPDIEVISKDTLKRWEINGRKAEQVEQAKEELVTQHVVDRMGMSPDDPGYEAMREVARQEIDFLSTEDKDGNLVLMHQFPNSRNAPIVELAIPREYSYGVRAAHGPDSGPGDIDLDPNQVYRLVAQAPDPRIEPKYGAAVRTYAIAPVDDDELEALGIEKADTMVRPDLTTTPYYDARDIRGRFTAAPASITEALAQARTKERTQRTLRTPRTQRTLHPVQTAAQQEVKAQTVASQQVRHATVAQAQAQVARMTQAAAKGAPVDAPGKTGPGYHPVDPGRSYAVMKPEDLAKLVGGGDGPLDPDTVAQIVGANYAHSRLTGVDEYNGRLLFGDDLHPDLYDMDEEWDEGEPEWEMVRTPYPLTMINEFQQVNEGDEAQTVYYKVDANAVDANATSMRLLANAMFENDPTITRLKLTMRGESDAVMAFRDLRDYSASTKPDPIVVVEIDDELKIGKPAVLEMVSETRKNRLIPPTNNTIKTEEADAPGLHEEFSRDEANNVVFRNPKIRLYKLRNK